MKVNSLKFRPLTDQDRSDIESVLNSRGERPLVGVNWDRDKVLKELPVTSSLAGFASGLGPSSLQAFILFKNLGSVIEILLIFSRKGSNDSADLILKALVDAYRQLDEIWLEVHEDNAAAIHFYERHGFLRVSQRSNYYPDGKAALNYNLSLKP